MKRKKCFKTVLSGILAAAMLFTSVPVDVLAAPGDPAAVENTVSGTLTEDDDSFVDDGTSKQTVDSGDEQTTDNEGKEDTNTQDPADDGANDVDDKNTSDDTNAADTGDGKTDSDASDTNTDDTEDGNVGEGNSSTMANVETGATVEGSNVTFTYVGDETITKVGVTGDMIEPAWSKDQPVMLDKGENNVFSKTMTFAPGNYSYKFIVEGEWETGDNRNFRIADPDGVESPVIDGRNVTFLYKDDTATQVRLAGNMTDWQNGALDLKKNSKGIWELKIELAPGAYQYKFIVGADGWIMDPGNANEPVSGNSTFVITGLADAKQDVKRGGSAALPATLKLWAEDGTSSDAAVTYALADATLADKVTLGSETVESATVTTVTVAADFPAEVEEFKLTATAGTATSTVTISVKDFTCEYTIYYYDPDPEHMAVDKSALWLWQTSGAGATVQTEFDGTEELSDGNTWLKKTIKLGYTDVSLIPKANGSWDWQDGNGKKFVNKEEKEAITLYTVYDDPMIYTELPEITVADPRYLVVEYTRTNGKATDWTFYTWNSGYGDKVRVPFEDEDGDGTGIAKVRVKQGLTSISFVLAQTDSMEEDPWVKDGGDNTCPLPVDQSVVKIKMEEGKGITYTYPYNIGYEIAPEEGKVNFYYRDDEAFLAGSEGGYGNVSLDVIAPEETSAQTYAMVYDQNEQRYKYALDELALGDYYYRYGRKQGADSEVEYVLDAFNDLQDKVGGVEYSVLKYDLLDINPEAVMSSESMDYNDNNVLTIKLNAKDKDGNPVEEQDVSGAISKATVDLSAVGGGITEIDPELLAISIAVKEDTSTGEKTLPVVIYDQYNNKYTTEAKVTVVSRDSSDFDWDEAVIYFAVTDRFFDGNASNNEGGVSGSYDKNTNDGSNSSYHGGDFAGLTKKLDYLQDLGVNTIWITPIVENQQTANAVTNDTVTQAWGYHGYWAKDFEKLDSHLGTEAEFNALLDAAHAKGMKVMVDVVLNHSGYGEAVTNYFNNNFKNEDGETVRMLRSDDEMVTGSDQQSSLSGLPDFRTEDPEVRELLVEWQSNWVSKYPIDYYRVDTVKHVDATTWSAFKNALTEINPDFKMIGEWAGAGYGTDTGMLRAGRMDSLLDFDFNDQAATFVTGNLAGAESFLAARNAAIDNTATLGSFLSSHDENGFIYTLMSKGKSEGEARNLALVAASLQLTAKGQVVIYYGEEIGDSTGQENYPYNTNRNDFDWSKVSNNNAALAHYKKMLAIRNEYTDVFAKGTRTTVSADNDKGLDVFKRSYGGTELTVALNITDEPVKYSLAVGNNVSWMKDCYSGRFFEVDEAGNVEITVPEAADGGTVVLVVAQDGPTAEADAGYKVTFNYNCYVPSKTIEVKPGQLITAKAMKEAGITEVTRDGYDLQAEWYKDAAYKTQWNFSTDTVQADTTLYALWLDVSNEGLKDTVLSVQDIQPMTYTGSALKPSVAVYADVKTADGKTQRVRLKANKDYKVTYKNNTNVYHGDVIKDTEVSEAAKPAWSNGPYVEIKGAGSYSGYVYKTFDILPANINDATLKYASQVVTGKAAKAVTSLKYKKALKEGKDYTVKVKNGSEVIAQTNGTKAATIDKKTAAGTYDLIIVAVGNGNYTGTRKEKIVIADAKKLLQKATVKLTVKSKTWDGGKPIRLAESDYTVKMGSKPLNRGTDFAVIKYKNNTNVGTATMILEGRGDYSGTKEVTFKIVSPAGSKFAIGNKGSITVMGDDTSADNKLADATYTGAPITRNVVLKTKETPARTLVSGKDYTITYKNNVKKGKATVTFTALPRSGFIGKFTMTFKIDQANLAVEGVIRKMDGAANTTGDWKATSQAVYTPAGAKLPGVTPYNESGVALKEKTDYQIVYNDVKNNYKKADNTTYVTLKGKGNYKGELKVYFKIRKATIDDLTITTTATQYNDKKSEIKPAVTVKNGKTKLQKDKQYDIKYENCEKVKLAKYFAYLADPSKPAEPAPVAVITLKDSANYETDAVHGVTELPLTIYNKAKKLTNKNVRVNFMDIDKSKDAKGLLNAYYEGGLQIRPEYSKVEFQSGNDWITLTEGTDFDVVWGANNKTGNKKGSIKIVGKGIYGGTATVTFNILKKPIDKEVSQTLVVDKATYDWYIDKLIEAYLAEALMTTHSGLDVEYNPALHSATVTVLGDAKNKPIKESIEIWKAENDTDENVERLDSLRWDAEEAFAADLKKAEKIILKLETSTKLPIIKPLPEERELLDPSRYITDKETSTLVEKVRENYEKMYDKMVERIKSDYGVEVKNFEDLIGSKVTATATIVYKDGTELKLTYKVEVE